MRYASGGVALVHTLPDRAWASMLTTVGCSSQVAGETRLDTYTVAALTADESASRFLVQATFGPTRAMTSAGMVP